MRRAIVSFAGYGSPCNTHQCSTACTRTLNCAGLSLSLPWALSKRFGKVVYPNFITWADHLSSDRRPCFFLVVGSEMTLSVFDALLMDVKMLPSFGARNGRCTFWGRHI